MPGITVIDVCRAMGVEPEKSMTWAVGSALQRRYEEIFERQPPKELRPKTNGGGSHCFAVYPETWRITIESLIKAHNPDPGRQGDLFR